MTTDSLPAVRRPNTPAPATSVRSTPRPLPKRDNAARFIAFLLLGLAAVFAFGVMLGLVTNPNY